MFKGKKILMAAGMAMAFFLGSAAVQAAPTDAAKEQFRQETLALVDCDKGKLVMEADLKSMVNCHYESELYFSAKPDIAGKGKVKMTIAVPDQPVSTIASEYYLQENDEQLVVYFQKPDNGWVKSTMAMPAEQKNLYMESNKELVQASLETVKAVELGQANGDRQSYIVTVDGDKIMPYFAKAMNMTGQKQDEMLAMIKPVLENMGDFTYTVEIDRAKHMVTGMQADLTQPMRKAVLSAIDPSKCTPEQVQQAKDIVNASTLTISLKTVALDKLPNLKVPKKVACEAKEVKAELLKGGAAVPGNAASN